MLFLEKSATFQSTHFTLELRVTKVAQNAYNVLIMDYATQYILNEQNTFFQTWKLLDL